MSAIYIGVMTGTSMDGVDIVATSFDPLTLHATLTIPFEQDLRDELMALTLPDDNEIDRMGKADVALAQMIGNGINLLIEKHNLDRTQIKAIGSHGQTIRHRPEHGFTLQIGDPNIITEITQLPVVSDFRRRDMAAGGQGAPLVPIGDKLLFSEYDYCLNLGGFSNVSFNENGNRIAFDISPVNTVLNFYANKLGFSYDDAGNFAKSGNINQDLLQQLNDLEFYALPYPKSLGMEFVNAKIFPLMNSYSIDVKDKLCTFVEHIAIQIANICSKPNAKLFITGGGAYNRFLIERLRNYLPTTELVIPDDKTIQFKEALIFGFLGVLRLRDEINVLSSVTGASKNHSSGVVFN